MVISNFTYPENPNKEGNGEQATYQAEYQMGDLQDTGQLNISLRGSLK